MKLKPIITAMLGMMSASGAFADTGTANITFDSEVTSTTCTLEAAQHAVASVIPDTTAKTINAATGETEVARSPDFALNFTACPAGITNINLVDVKSSGGASLTNATTFVVPEGGTARGVAVGTTLNSTTVALGQNVNSGITAPVDGSGAASFTGSNFIVHESGVPAATGDYNTTFTLTFDWS